MKGVTLVTYLSQFQYFIHTDGNIAGVFGRGPCNGPSPIPIWSDLRDKRSEANEQNNNRYCNGSRQTNNG